jgi:hypothetical protein
MCLYHPIFRVQIRQQMGIGIRQYCQEAWGFAAPTAGLTLLLLCSIGSDQGNPVTRDCMLVRGHFSPSTVRPSRNIGWNRKHSRSLLEPPIQYAIREEEVITVGTTVARTLESIALGHNGQIVPEVGEQFIYLSLVFLQVRDGLLTTFTCLDPLC